MGHKEIHVSNRLFYIFKEKHFVTLFYPSSAPTDPVTQQKIDIVPFQQAAKAERHENNSEFLRMLSKQVTYGQVKNGTSLCSRVNKFFFVGCSASARKKRKVCNNDG